MNMPPHSIMDVIPESSHLYHGYNYHLHLIWILSGRFAWTMFFGFWCITTSTTQWFYSKAHRSSDQLSQAGPRLRSAGPRLQVVFRSTPHGFILGFRLEGQGIPKTYPFMLDQKNTRSQAKCESLCLQLVHQNYIDQKKLHGQGQD